MLCLDGSNYFSFCSVNQELSSLYALNLAYLLVYSILVHRFLWLGILMFFSYLYVSHFCRNILNPYLLQHKIRDPYHFVVCLIVDGIHCWRLFILSIITGTNAKHTFLGLVYVRVLFCVVLCCQWLLLYI